MLTAGQTVSHYRILERIGAGGMGDVYKALDTRLDRTVALKILPPEAVRDPERRRRFTQEAKAASALDHPNIVVVHDIGEDQGIHFIAMQYVAGRTLQERLGGMKLSEALSYAIQMADALAAAHAHGIVHRDLKPANVVVSEQGVAKILDFGVAKLTELGDSEEAPTREQNAPLTREGNIIGTAAYMSPEQAEGRKVDARSDIFSFGSVLYEMVTGTRAFAGTSLPSILAAVLRDEPKALSDLLPKAPIELERILTRALRKDPGRRFQSMAELKIALEDLRSEIETGSAVTAKARQIRRTIPVAAWAAGAAVLAVAGLAYLRFGGREGDSLPPPRVVPLTTAPGYEEDPALSPDGRQVAFVTERDLYVRLIDAGQELRLTDNTEPEARPAWSPDGSRVAFIRHVEEDGEIRDGIFVITALGGPEKRLGTSLAEHHGLSWSADGGELAVVNAERVGDVNAIYLLTVDSGGMRKLTNPPRECQEPLRACGDASPVFSPDGRTIAFIRLDSEPAIYTVAPDGGELKRITRGYLDLWEGSLAWAADGKNIISSLYSGRISRIPISGGEPEPLVFTEEGARAPSISRGGNRLAYEKPLSDLNIWKVPGPRSKDKGPPQRFITSTRDDRGARFSPDGKQIVFVSDRSGSAEVWLSDANGESARKPFAASEVGGVAWSPDGREMLVDQVLESRDLFVGSADSGRLRPLTDWPGGEYSGAWSRDGRRIYFTRSENAGGAHEIWRIAAAGGEPIRVTRGGGRWGRESPDPKYVLFTRDDVSGIWRVPVEGGADEKLIETTGPVGNRWDVFEEGVCYLDWPGDVATLRYRDLASGEAMDLATLEGSFGSGLSVSPDGQWVLLTKQDAAGTDLMLVENFR